MFVLMKYHGLALVKDLSLALVCIALMAVVHHTPFPFVVFGS